ncbi:hypothetical protein AB0T83_09865 [Fluviibacterium sp. DFM31]|uniref:DUF4410 domain-containing protein n=1 Tax=Meridianimarinicoccus marinus TaxID=3231483 RepID=A0ABV3L677_9RHOB
MTLLRLLPTLLALAVLSACTTELDPEIQKTGLGDFSLDRLVVVMDDKPQSGFHSRKVSNDTLKAAVVKAVEPRLSRFDGEGSYSIGIKVQGYILAHPGVPVLLAPRSTLFLSVNVYDDVPRRLNPKPANLTVWEDAGGDTVVGSGYTQTGEEQLAELADNAAIEIERWLRENPQWFKPKPGAAPADAAPDED